MALTIQGRAALDAYTDAQLYTDSDVNLNAATGKLRRYYQGVPDDFKDYDMQASPISATINGVLARPRASLTEVGRDVG